MDYDISIVAHLLEEWIALDQFVERECAGRHDRVRLPSDGALSELRHVKEAFGIN